MLIIAFIKIRYPFWNIQPVYHSYDICRWFYWRPFVFYRHGPVKTKYCDFLHVSTKPYSDISEIEKQLCCDLLQTQYLSTDRIFCVLGIEDINAYMTGFNDPTFLSFYSMDYFDVSSLRFQSRVESPIGCMVSKPAYIHFKNSEMNLNIYYWDFICMHRDYNKQGTVRQLIQTHEFQQRMLNPEIRVSIFKKEVALCRGVVPITQFKTRTYYLQMAKLPKMALEYTCVRILKENVQMLYDSLLSLKVGFDLSLIPDIGILVTMITAKLWYIYILKHKDHVCGIYFFKDLRLHYEDMDTSITNSHKNADDLGNSIHCFASIQSVETPLFYLGFVYSLYLLLKFQPKYRILLIDEIADNAVLLSGWNKAPIFETDTAYYFFNYFYPYRHSSEKCLFLV